MAPTGAQMGRSPHCKRWDFGIWCGLLGRENISAGPVLPAVQAIGSQGTGRLSMGLKQRLGEWRQPRKKGDRLLTPWEAWGLKKLEGRATPGFLSLPEASWSEDPFIA